MPIRNVRAGTFLYHAASGWCIGVPKVFLVEVVVTMDERMNVDAEGALDEQVGSGPPAAALASPSAQRERSTIEFPYSNLEDAEQGAKALFAEAGMTEVSLAQAAAAMKVSATSSGFRLRLTSMKMFGLLDGDQGRVRLTDLGRGVAEAQTALESRAKAFARVPLYAKVIENHDGRTLPPPTALEREFSELGVAKKQTDRARQAFDRSARWAGYIKAGSDRFVSPILRNERPSASTDPGDGSDGQQSMRQNPGGGAANENDGLDPVIRALVQKIPPTGAPWGSDEQVMWLRMMAMAFSMAFGGKRTIKIEAEPESSRS
jgi:hypothetical protein